MEQIILQQMQRYPQMNAQDLIKLLYQQEFGAEHLMKDAAAAEKRIESEIAMPQAVLTANRCMRTSARASAASTCAPRQKNCLFPKLPMPEPLLLLHVLLYAAHLHAQPLPANRF